MSPSRAERRALAKAVSRGAVDLKAAAGPDRALPTVTIGYAWSEKRGVSGFWHKSIVQTLAGLAGSVRFSELSIESGPFLSRARNTIVEHFLKGGSDYLLMTDTDAVFEPADVKALLDADVPIAGALVYTMVTGVQPFAAVMLRNETTGDYEVAPPDFLPEIPSPPAPPEDLEDEAALKAYQDQLMVHEVQSGLLLQPKKVGAIGCTLTLYRRDVVEAVRQVYKLPFEYLGDVGEDITFCDRAAEMGFETWLVPQARIGHAVSVVV